MNGTAMPEATVHEYSHPCGNKRYVGPTPNVWQDWAIEPKSQAATVQFLTKCHLRTCVTSSCVPHAR